MGRESWPCQVSSGGASLLVQQRPGSFELETVLTRLALRAVKCCQCDLWIPLVKHGKTIQRSQIPIFARMMMIVILMIVYVVVILIKMIPIVNGHFKMLSSSFSIDCLKYQWSTAKKSILSSSRSCWEPLPGLQTAVLFLFVIMSHDMSAAHRFCNSLGCLFHIYGMKAIC